MQFNFRQGIVRIPVGSLTYSGGFVSVNISGKPLEVSMAFKDTNYFHAENANVSNAWNVNAVVGTAYLYIDLDTITGVRTFGYTMYDMVYGPTAPINPANDQHWFDTTTNQFKRYIALTLTWVVVVRVFVGTFTPNTVTYPYRNPLVSHINVTGPSPAGRILYDGAGEALKLSTGEFLTTETDFYTYGGVANTIRLESDVTLVKALNYIPAYSVVAVDGFGTSGYPTIRLASYNDVNDTIIAICPVELNTGEITTIVTRGLVANNSWDWESLTTAGAQLYVGIGATLGTLVASDPHITYPLLAPTRKPAVAKVLSTTSVLFQQSFEAAGLTGEPGPAGPGASAATATAIGTVLLSVASLTPSAPVVVEITDPVLYAARTPLAHSQAATTITTTTTNVQDDIDTLTANKLDLTGGTVTGNITLTSTPVNPTHVARLQDIDTQIAAASSLFVTLTGNNNITGINTFTQETTFTNKVFLTTPFVEDNQAVHKLYVDTAIGDCVLRAGDTMTGLLLLPPVVETDNGLRAVTKDYVDSSSGPDWLYKNADFDIVYGERYIVDTSVADVSGTLPEGTTLPTNFFLQIKDANVSGGFSPTKKFVLKRGISALYTIMNDLADFDVDTPNPELSFGYDSINNNVVI